MGMVVRTNTMAMNANRQLGMNNSQVAKSLEKLSSGFKINRAADDASGLAISEKMKAQIKGLETASANSQDGISLIQTAEGGAQEIHDMLNRMVELATKSANGTIQDDVDREAIQREVDDLNAEITRISKSTNFNGINLLDGNLSTKGMASATGAGSAPMVSGAGTLNKQNATNGAQSFQFGTNLGKVLADGALEMEVELSDGSTRTVYAVLKKDATAASVSASLEGALKSDDELAKLFDITVAGDNSAADKASKFTFTSKEAGTGAVYVTGLTFKEKKPAAADGSWDDATAGEIIKDAAGTPANLPTTKQSMITETVAKDEYQQISFGADTVTNDSLAGQSITIGTKTYTFAKGADLYNVKEGNVGVALGNTRNETMKNLAAALKSNGVSSAEVDGNNIKIGNLDQIKAAQPVAMTSGSKGITLGNTGALNGEFTTSAAIGAGTAATSYDLSISYTDQDGKAQTAKVSYTGHTTALNNAQNMAAAINGDDALKDMFSAKVDGSGKLVITALNDTKGMTITGLSTSDAAGAIAGTATKAFGAGQTVDLDLNKIKSGDTMDINGKTYQFLKAADTADAKAGATVVIIDENGTAATAEENTVKNLQAAMQSNGLQSKVKGAGGDAQLLIEADTKIVQDGGLTLQIGDTGDDFNKVTVSVDDLSANGIGTAGLNVSNQTAANKSIDTIKAAINQVSTNRANLGSLQNRLEHTINNLDTTAENMTAANSRIRDTDMAKEMMNYTKMNVLTQAAQAMLAQANQQPQSILQLLQ